MPRYCDACRTFITSRDSLTRNTTPGALRHTPLNPTTGAPKFTLPNLWGTPREKVMTPRHTERQGIPSRSCPNNRGLFQAINGYSGVVIPVLEYPYPKTTISCVFANLRPCPYGRLSFVSYKL